MDILEIFPDRTPVLHSNVGAIDFVQYLKVGIISCRPEQSYLFVVCLFSLQRSWRRSHHCELCTSYKPEDVSKSVITKTVFVRFLDYFNPMALYSHLLGQSSDRFPDDTARLMHQQYGIPLMFFRCLCREGVVNYAEAARSSFVRKTEDGTKISLGEQVAVNAFLIANTWAMYFRWNVSVAIREHTIFCQFLPRLVLTTSGVGLDIADF